MKSYPNVVAPPLPDREELLQELLYLRRCAESNAAKILQLDLQCLTIRHELEQKRRGFSLMAELAVRLRQNAEDHESVFVSVSRRLNAALNMQRTVILKPEADGSFSPAILQGYPPEEKAAIEARRIPVDKELLDPARLVIVTGADGPERLAALREAIALPYLVAAPVILHNTPAAVIITGRVVEQMPWMPRLGLNDAETVQTVSTHMAAVLAEQRFSEAEERNKIMLDALPICCSFWDEDFNNIDCNAEAARLFNLSGKQEYLERFHDLSPEYQPDGTRSRDKSTAKIREAFAKGQTRFEWMHQTLDGEEIPTEIILVHVKKGVGYVVGYTRDLREQKAMLAEMLKTETQLRNARDIAEKNARAKSEFLANMSHEIRTPMNAILGMTHLLAGTEMTDKQRNYVEKAEHSANLLLRIINDILDFSKIDAGRMEMEHISFSTAKMLRNVRNMMQPQVEAKQLSLRVMTGIKVPERLVGDPLRLEQVLLNLTNNAVKFTEQGEIAVTLAAGKSPEPGKVVLEFSVSDTGIGMTREQVNNLFVPFSQADTSITRKYGGTGLGLAISKSLVDLMDGEIRCTSAVGKGSTFTFTVPLRIAGDAGHAGAAPSEDDETAPLSPQERGKPLEDISGMRVLLAEDNEINRMVASELLSHRGVIVDTADNGLEAVEAVRRNTYDVVLMDIQMPEMDGLTATAEIRKDPAYKDLPIIAMTAHAMVGDREISLSGGMDDHLTKPIDPVLLHMALLKWGKPRGS